jgi:transposase InsO family protein
MHSSRQIRLKVTWDGPAWRLEIVSDGGRGPHALLTRAPNALSLASLSVARHGLAVVHVTSDGVVFRHPLIRAAAYQEAPFARRVAAHRALARVLTDPHDADRRAWHFAAAADGPDDAAADGLEQVAQRATGRGAAAAAARALDRAAQLTAGPAVRGRRFVAAAQAAYDAGQLDRAAELDAWVQHYNTERAHSALRGQPPISRLRT